MFFQKCCAFIKDSEVRRLIQVSRFLMFLQENFRKTVMGRFIILLQSLGLPFYFDARQSYRRDACVISFSRRAPRVFIYNYHTSTDTVNTLVYTIGKPQWIEARPQSDLNFYSERICLQPVSPRGWYQARVAGNTPRTLLNLDCFRQPYSNGQRSTEDHSRNDKIKRIKNEDDR